MHERVLRLFTLDTIQFQIAQDHISGLFESDLFSALHLLQLDAVHAAHFFQFDRHRRLIVEISLAFVHGHPDSLALSCHADGLARAKGEHCDPEVRNEFLDHIQHNILRHFRKGYAQ